MITSTANQKVKNVVALQKKAKERKEQRLFVAEGRKMVLEVLRDAPEAVAEVYVTGEYLGDAKQAEELCGVSYEMVSESVMKAMAATLEPQGILALVRMPEYDFNRLWQQEDGLWIALENLRDPGNLGTILRTAEAAGVSGVILSPESVDIYNPKVIRSTMGSIFRVPFLYVEDTLATMQLLQDNGVKLYAAYLSGSEQYDKVAYADRSAIMIGNEANGLLPETAAAADVRVRIPMAGELESLNAAVAAAILMYHTRIC